MNTIKGLAIAVVLVLCGLGLGGCQDLEGEARVAAKKFWESQAFSSCGGSYFGKRDGKIYQFDMPMVVVTKSGRPGDELNFEWSGLTSLTCGQWRTFENGAWTPWQEEKYNWPSPGIADFNCQTILGMLLARYHAPEPWIFGNGPTNPSAYQPVVCKDVEALHPPP